MEDPHPLELHRVYGFSSGLPGAVVDLRTKEQNLLGYAAGHTIVILDVASENQMILQGHVHAIRCIRATHDKKCVLSADCGPDASLILWNCSTGQVMQATSLQKSGSIVAMDISPDDHLMVTLTDTINDRVQELNIWHIKSFESGPLATVVVPSKKPQICVQFNGIDQNEFVTNGKDTVFFWRQCKETTNTGSTTSLKCLRAVFKANEVKQTVGPFTVSSFLTTTLAITATINGDVIVWDNKRISPQVQENSKHNTKGSLARAMHAIKVVKLHNTAITTLVPIGQYVVTGGADGYVHFYDSRLVLTAWLEDLSAGDITSISFSKVEGDYQDNTSYELPVPSFVIGTKRSHILLLHAGMFDEPPGSPQSKVFDYKKNRICEKRCFQELQVYESSLETQGSTIRYSPSGAMIACGFVNGALKMIEADTLEDVQSFSFATSTICQLEFSNDGVLLATADTSFAVALLVLEHVQEVEKWCYIGKFRSHARCIAGLKFSITMNGSNRLFSVGHDNMLVEYDLIESSPENGLQLKKTWLLNFLARPSSILSISQAKTDKLQMLISDEGFKMRLYDTERCLCNKTFSGPSFSSPVTNLATLCDQVLQKEYLVYTTKEQIIGIMIFPDEAKQNLYIEGVVAHSGCIVSVAISHDHKHVITCGADRECSTASSMCGV